MYFNCCYIIFRAIVVLKEPYDQQLDMINYILKEAPELTEVRNSDGETPLCLACNWRSYHEVITLLMQTNPKTLNMRHNDGATPLYWCKLYFSHQVQYSI
jgi:ankyrin repeat protein